MRSQPVVATKENFAGVGLHEPQQHPRKRRLSAAGFAHDAERLTARERKAHAIHGNSSLRRLRERSSRNWIKFSQLPYFQKNFGLVAFRVLAVFCIGNGTGVRNVPGVRVGAGLRIRPGAGTVFGGNMRLGSVWEESGSAAIVSFSQPPRLQHG